MRLPALAVALPLLLAGHAATAATVEVTVGGIRNNHGHILVAICDKAAFLHPDCPWHGRAPAQPGHVTISIPGVPPGTYAAQAFHDENDDGKLNTNFFGMPREAMGFSNDAKMHLGPPGFADAAFTVGSGTLSIAFSLRYF